MDTYGGPDHVRMIYLRRAIKKGLIRPYGIVNDEVPAECDAEKSPQLGEEDGQAVS